MMSTDYPNKRAKFIEPDPSHLPDSMLERFFRLYAYALVNSRLYREDIMEILERNPSTGNFHYLFTAFPEAARKNRENKSLLYASVDVAAYAIKICTVGHALDASLKMVSLVADTCPIALGEREFLSSGCTPLAHVLRKDAPMELITLLFEKCPEATIVKDNEGTTALHLAFQTHDSQGYSDKKNEFDQVNVMVTSMLQQFPRAARIKDDEALTPLHFAVLVGSGQVELICLLLEKHPEAIKERDDNGYTPLDWEKDLSGEFSPDDPIAIILVGASRLFDEDLGKAEVATIAAFFASMKWWSGVPLVFELVPSAVESYMANTPASTLPHLLSALGRRDKMFAMWNALRNMQHILIYV